MRTEMHSFDTHAHVKALITSGLEEPQAEAIVNTFVKSREYDFANLATKEQVDAIVKELAQFVTKEELKAEIATLHLNILKWMLPFFITIIGMIATIMFRMFIH